MKLNSNGRIVLVTCGSRKEARRIAARVVKKRLAACVNIVSAPVESIYRWKGKIARASECLMIAKTTKKRLPELENEVKKLHSYDVPEFIALAIVAGAKDYLAWISESTKVQKRKIQPR